MSGTKSHCLKADYSMLIGVRPRKRKTTQADRRSMRRAAKGIIRAQPEAKKEGSIFSPAGQYEELTCLRASAKACELARSSEQQQSVTQSRDHSSCVAAAPPFSLRKTTEITHAVSRAWRALLEQ